MRINVLAKQGCYSLSSGERRGKSLNLFFAQAKNGGCKGVTSGAFLGLNSRIVLEGVIRRSLVRRSTLERDAIEGNSPVFENHFALLVILLKYLEERTP